MQRAARSSLVGCFGFVFCGWAGFCFRERTLQPVMHAWPVLQPLILCSMLLTAATKYLNMLDGGCMRILFDFISFSMLWSITSRCCLHCPFHPGYRCTIFTTYRGMRCLRCWFGRMYGFCCDQCRRLISFEGPLHWTVSSGSAWWTVHMQRSWEQQCPGLGLCLRWIRKLPSRLRIGMVGSVVGAYKQTQQYTWFWPNGCLSCEQAVPACLTPLLLLALTWMCVLGTVSKPLCRVVQAQTKALYWSLAKLLHQCRTWMTCLIAYVGTWNRREQVQMTQATTMIAAMIGNLLPALGCHGMKTALAVPAVAPGVARESGAERGSGLIIHPVVHRRDHLRLYRFMVVLLPLLLVLQTLTFPRVPLIRARSYGRKTFGDVVAPRPGQKEAPPYGGRFWLEIARLIHGRRRRTTLMLRQRKGRRKKNLIQTPSPRTFPGHQTDELDVKWNESSKRMLRRRRKRATSTPQGSLEKSLQAGLARHPGPRLIRMMAISDSGCKPRTRLVSALRFAAGCFSMSSDRPDFCRGDFVRSAWQFAAGPLAVKLPHSQPSAFCAAKQQDHMLDSHHPLPGASSDSTVQLQFSSLPRHCQVEFNDSYQKPGADLGPFFTKFS